MLCLVYYDVIKVHDVSSALDLSAAVFVLFVYGEKLLLNHEMNKPLQSVIRCTEFIQSLGFQIVLKVSHLFTFRTIFSASGLYN